MLTNFPRLLVVGAVLFAARMVVAGTPEPRDRPYPGNLTLSVKATDLAHRTCARADPRQGGRVDSVVPEMASRSSQPQGAIESLPGLHISGSGHEIAWLRDPLDVYAFHLKVPPGSNSWKWRLSLPHRSEPGSRPSGRKCSSCIGTR